MRHFRFSLSALLWFVVVVAIAFAALASPLGWCRTALKATTLCCLFFAILAALRGQQSLRSFWLGFAVVGWGYFALQHVMDADLPTHEVSLKAQRFLRPTKRVSGRIANIEETQACREVVRWLWPSLLGFVGGVAAHCLDVKRDVASRSPP